MFLPHCLSNSEDRLACIADLQVVHADGQDHSHQRLRGRLCISLTACTHRSMRITTSFCSAEAKKFSPVLQKTNRLLLYIRVYDENWYVAHQLIYQMKIGVRSGDSRKWTDRRSETVRRERKKTLSLLCASQLVASDVAASWVARSFAKKIFKKNPSDQGSGEPFRRWFEIHRTGSPYRWTGS